MSWVLGKDDMTYFTEETQSGVKTEYCSINMSFLALASLTFLLYFKMSNMVFKTRSGSESLCCHWPLGNSSRHSTFESNVNRLLVIGTLVHRERPLTNFMLATMGL